MPTKKTLVRAASLVVYLAIAALGLALVARPADLWLRGLGLLRPELPWIVPLGGAYALLAAAIVAVTLALAVAWALQKKLRFPGHPALLLLVALALAARAGGLEPSPPPDPRPALLDGLRTVAAHLDRGYAADGRYAPDAAGLKAATSALPAPGFCRSGRTLPLRARILRGALEPQAGPLENDSPGTIYVAIAPGGRRAWLTAVTLASGRPAILRDSDGTVVLETRAGTHAEPGRDPGVPTYPGMRTRYPGWSRRARASR